MLACRIRKLLELNRRTGIETRALVAPFEHSLWHKQSPQRPTPSIDEVDAIYRKSGTRMSVDACRKAIHEWGGRHCDITHVVAVTCTNAGSPGFDQEVAKQLNLSNNVDKTLLHGVGCAGGLACLRAARQMADAATLQGRKAHVLLFACELTSIHVSVELEDALENAQTSIGPVLFGDGASAMVLSNEISSTPANSAVYELVDTSTTRVSETESLMSYHQTMLGES